MTEGTLLEFPCEFPIKVVGAADVGLQALVAGILSRHVPDLDNTAITTRPSRNGRYIAVTARITARDQAQLDAIYAELSAHDDVIMAL